MLFSNRHIILFSFLAAGLLAGGCHRTDPEESSEEIRFEVSDEWHNGNETRAIIVSNDGDLIPKGILINAYNYGTTTPYIGNAQLAYDGASSAWRFYQGGYVRYYWPNEGSLDFVAYTPYLLTYTYVSIDTYTVAGGPAFTCSDLPVTSSGQSTVREFMYAYVTGKNKAADAASGVELEFYHPFAIINLDVKNSHRAIHRLNTITFNDIKNNGSFTYKNLTPWAPDGEDTDLTLTLGQGIAQDASLSSSQKSTLGCPIIVLPQTLVTTNQIEVKITWNDGDAENTYTFDNPVSQWQPGKVYNYTLDLLGEIKFSVTIDDWSSEETPRNIRF